MTNGWKRVKLPSCSLRGKTSDSCSMPITRQFYIPRSLPRRYFKSRQFGQSHRQEAQGNGENLLQLHAWIGFKAPCLVLSRASISWEQGQHSFIAFVASVQLLPIMSSSLCLSALAALVRNTRHQLRQVVECIKLWLETAFSFESSPKWHWLCSAAWAFWASPAQGMFRVWSLWQASVWACSTMPALSHWTGLPFFLHINITAGLCTSQEKQRPGTQGLSAKPERSPVMCWQNNGEGVEQQPCEHQIKSNVSSTLRSTSCCTDARHTSGSNAAEPS